MARYIIIDNCSGYIWGDSADLAGHIFVGTPIEYAAALDADIGDPGRIYEECHHHALASNEGGYHVYRADVSGSDAVPVVWDGQDQETIEAVLRDCEYVTSLRWSRGEG
jgi:hypothetical protein